MYYIISHSGVKGMKHGVRRYQNEDGSLTPLGRQHYGVGPPRQKKEQSTQPKPRFRLFSKPETSKPKKNPASKAKSITSKQFKSVSKKEAKKIAREAIEDQKADRTARADRKAAVKKRRSLSSEDIQKRIERINLEKKLREVTAEDLNPGKAMVNRILSNASEKVLSAGAAGLMAFAMNTLLTRINPDIGRAVSFKDQGMDIKKIAKEMDATEGDVKAWLKAAKIDYNKAAAYIAPNPNSKNK